jgi:acyl carrier protein
VLISLPCIGMAERRIGTNQIIDLAKMLTMMMLLEAQFGISISLELVHQQFPERF